MQHQDLEDFHRRIQLSPDRSSRRLKDLLRSRWTISLFTIDGRYSSDISTDRRTRLWIVERFVVEWSEWYGFGLGGQRERGQLLFRKDCDWFVLGEVRFRSDLSCSYGRRRWVIPLSFLAHRLRSWQFLLVLYLDGYEFWNERTLVTIFSAPNYCGTFSPRPLLCHACWFVSHIS